MTGFLVGFLMGGAIGYLVRVMVAIGSGWEVESDDCEG